MNTPRATAMVRSLVRQLLGALALMLALAMGVVTGPLRAMPVRSTLSTTCCGSDWPVLAMMSPLSSATSQSMDTPVASMARRAAEETSGPIPSPGIKVTL